MFKTIKAKFAGTCKRCGQPFEAGTNIRWAKRAGSYHLSSQCPAGKQAERPLGEDNDDGEQPVPVFAGGGEHGHAPDVDQLHESQGEAWARRQEEGWGPGGY